MDTTGDFGLEFLDLTGVDEYERNWVLSSLQPLHPNVRFPWFIGDGDSHTAGIKASKPPLDSQAHAVVNSHNYTLGIIKTPGTGTVIDPDNNLFVPLHTKNELVTDPGCIQSNFINNAVNDSAAAPMNNQYYNPLPQYFNSPVVTTISSGVPLHIPHPNYGIYSNASSSEIPTNTTIYPPYIPPTYPAKPPVFYGVPPAQPVFVSHHSAADVGRYYQNNVTAYVSTTIPVDSKQPQEEQWKNENTGNMLETSSNPASNLVEDQTVTALKPVSPLSAETPAFTPKYQQNVSVEMQDNAGLEEIEAQRPEPQSQKNTIEPLDSITPVQTAPPVVQDTTPKQANVWNTGKSFASLFTPKQGTVHSPEVNGVTKAAFPKPVNMGSNSERTCPIKNPKRNHFIDPDCYRMGEFLANYNVDGRAISLQPKGLINQSNYCYINSILQALIACPPMYNLLCGLAENISSNAKRKPTPVIDGMCKFVKEYKHLPANMRVNNRRSEGGKKDQKKDQGVMINTDIPFEPSWIYKILHGLQTDLMEGRQEDAEEFLGCLLNNLSDEMLELMKLVETSEKSPPPQTEEEDEAWQVMGVRNKGSVLRKTEFERTPITDIFGGSLKSRIQRVGGLNTENTQPFLTLPLNIEKVKTVREALEALTTKNQLEGLTSSKTKEKVEAWQQVMLDELPVILVLHLKCFDFQLNGCTKILKALEFPIDLKIDTKLLSSKTTNAKEKQYKLFAVVYHDGKEATKGHYVTDAFHVGYSSWLRYDDASVKPVQEEQVLNPQGTRVPYLLFYRRSDTIRR